MTEDTPQDEREQPEGYPPAGLITYLIAGAVYVALGVEFHWLLSWTRGFGFALVAVWLVPTLYNRWRDKRRSR